MIEFDYDESYKKARLRTDDAILLMIRNHFSVVDKSASFANRKLKAQGSTKKVPDRKYCIGASGLFDFGMYNEIRKFLISESITEITYTDKFIKRLKVGFGDITVSDTLKYNLRDYQAEALTKAFKMGCGTIVVGTGGGKSLLQASLLENWKEIKPEFKCVVIVPGLGLVSQLLKDFEEYGATFTYSGWTGGPEGMPLQDTQVVIVNTENFYNRFGDYKWISDVDVLLTDECHKVKDQNVLTKYIQKVKTPNKFGFTGTLPKTEIDKWKIIGTFGPVIYEKKSKSLRDEGFLTNAEIKILKLNHKPKKFSYKQEIEYLENLDKRNNLVVNLSKKLNNNILILVNHLEHGHELLSMFNSDKAHFVYGEMPVEQRQEIIDLMETNTDIVCIAMSSIFSTGINIKNLHYIIFTFGGKSFIRTIQSIGRGLRLHDTKEKVVIFDICDNMKYSLDHLEERIQFYDEEEFPWKIKDITI